jgi:hypothetical protein
MLDASGLQTLKIAAIEDLPDGDLRITLSAEG